PRPSCTSWTARWSAPADGSIWQGRRHPARRFRAHGAAAPAMATRAGSVGSRASIRLRPVGAPPRGRTVKAVLVGATRGMGRALARLLAGRGDALALLGRDPNELLTSSRDLAARGASGPVVTGHLGLAEPEGCAAARAAAERALGSFDA